jgi:hypothetical protein
VARKLAKQRRGWCRRWRFCLGERQRGVAGLLESSEGADCVAGQGADTSHPPPPPTHSPPTHPVEKHSRYDFEEERGHYPPPGGTVCVCVGSGYCCACVLCCVALLAMPVTALALRCVSWAQAGTQGLPHHVPVGRCRCHSALVFVFIKPAIMANGPPKPPPPAPPPPPPLKRRPCVFWGIVHPFPGASATFRHVLCCDFHHHHHHLRCLSPSLGVKPLGRSRYGVCWRVVAGSGLSWVGAAVVVLGLG